MQQLYAALEILKTASLYHSQEILCNKIDDVIKLIKIYMEDKE